MREARTIEKNPDFLSQCRDRGTLFFFLKLITYMWSRRGIWYASANRSGFKGAGS